ncbi:MAG: preprotein translocase subunit YajC [Planctomycetota bacterium]|nr:preprotein translocase subunit YajC [Planctomycetota bacterium]
MFHHAGWTMVILAQVEEAPAQNPGLAAEVLGSPLFMFGLLGFMFWIMILRPQNRKRREHEAELKKLKVHDRVVTAGGILGTVIEAKEDSDELTIRIDEVNNTRMRILRSAISRKVTDYSGQPAES